MNLACENNLNSLFAALDILDGYIEPYRLGSIVQFEENNEIFFGVIIGIHKSKAFCEIQLFDNNKRTKTVNIEETEVFIINTSPPSVNETMIDLFGEFLSIDDSSLMVLQVKRRTILILSYVLNNQKTIEMFMNKPYAKILAELCQLDIEEKNCQKLKDLRMFTKQHLELYYLRLNQSQIEIEEEIHDNSNVIIDNTTMKWKGKIPDPSILSTLSNSIQGWRPYAFEYERDHFTKGRIGHEEISIVSIPKNRVSNEAIQECGTKHRFHGRIAPTAEHTYDSHPQFTIDNLRLAEGKWYYCVRLPVAGSLQIGWTADVLSLSRYKWLYDGSQGIIFSEYESFSVFDDIRWKSNDVCGCGIEIDGNNTNIKYWLNGKLLGTAFQHKKRVGHIYDEYEFDLLPNGPSTAFYPMISIGLNTDSATFCELIVSPEDMLNCPSPEGYKPLLLPKFVRTENSIIDYPSHAYLIGENSNDFLLTKRRKSKMNNFLRDFVYDKHLSTAFEVDDQFLILTKESNGLPMHLNIQQTPSMTISFDYEIYSIDDQQSNSSLIKFNSTDISWQIANEKQTCIIVYLSKEQQIKIYTNDQFQIFHQIESVDLLYILPKVCAQIQNLATWNYALSEEQISSLFTYGLFYIAADYQRLKEYRKHVNCISFVENQTEFLDESLLNFNEPFTKNLWEKKKEEVDDDESKYFQTSSTVELLGNKTYLVLNKSDGNWTNYTLGLEFSVPQYSKRKKKITLITLNSNCNVYLNDYGRISFENHESSSIIQPKEFVRLFLILHEDSLQIYLNENLEIDLQVTDNRYHISSNFIVFFKEHGSFKNLIDENTLRISLRSITYLNRSVSGNQLRSPALVSPSFEMIRPSLISMGYKKSWIEKVMQEYPWKDVRTILHEKKQDFQQSDIEQEQKRCFKLISTLSPSMTYENLKHLLQSFKFDTDKQIFEFIQQLSPNLDIFSLLNFSPLELNFHEYWFSQLTEDFLVPHRLLDWISAETLTPNDNSIVDKFYGLEELSKKKANASLTYPPQILSIQQMSETQHACEYGLISTYAQYGIQKMYEVWSNNDITSFPIEKFGDYSVIKLFDQIDPLIESILTRELNEFSHSLFNYLRNEIVTQSIRFFIKPALINENNTNFLLKILRIFVKLINDERLISNLFPIAMINLIFDLFILIPFHEAKLAILRIFTTLTQISSTALFGNHIQSFFFQFLIELSTTKPSSLNETLSQRYQIALTELIYNLIVKQKPHFDDFPSKVPESIQNLFLLIEIIDVWCDQKKEKLFPENVLQKADELFKHKYNLTQENFQKSNSCFNYNADQELIHYINSTLPLIKSEHKLIEELPTQSKPNPTFYRAYVNLSSIPADCIQIRAKFIHLFNICLNLCLPIINLNLPPEQSYLVNQIRTVKSYIFLKVKRHFFNESLEKTKTNGKSKQTVYFNTIAASTDSKNTWFHQAFRQLYSNAPIIFRQTSDQLWHATFEGMNGVDAGGLYRDSITRICSDICSTRLSLFILCPNGRMNDGYNRDCWIPNVYPLDKRIDKEIQKQYHFIGQLLGMAIRQKHYLDIKFAPLFWKKLLNEQMTVEDIESIDTQSFRRINQMKRDIEQMHSSEDEIFSSLMSDLYFDVNSSSGKETFELIRDGSTIAVDANNVQQYFSAYKEYRLNEFNRPIDLIRQGLYSVVPSSFLSLFTGQELEEAVCGKREIDVELLKRNTRYENGYNTDSVVIQRFWKVMSEMFTNDQKKLFLTFVWGRNTLPKDDHDFRSKFTISRLDNDRNDLDKLLPRKF